MLLAPMVARLQAQRDLPSILGTACRDTVALHGAEFGNVQLIDGDSLLLVHGEGFSRAFIAAVGRVGIHDGTVCARAWRSRKTIHVPDVSDDPAFAPYLSFAGEAGFRAVLSSPLISSGGEVVGVISSHFANPKVPTAIEMHTREAYCRELADHLLSCSSAALLATEARRLNKALMRPPAARRPTSSASSPSRSRPS